ncbi:MAG: sensor histidine kinase, partial [Pseudolabrys sp.]|nr:sensor histidine kinase [Pseudolabrys sp.]
MTISNEKPDLAVPSESSPVRRRLAAQYVRDARDRLISTTGTRPVFDLELLRQYAQNRLSASLVILLLVATIGFLSSLWTGAVAAGSWTASVLVIHAVIITKCRQFLAETPNEVQARRWRLRFIILDLFYGLAWMFILIHPVGVDESSGTFMLFVMLLVVAVSSMLASSLPMAVFAATFPVTSAIALDFLLQGSLRDYILAIMAVTAQGYFALLAYRLYSTTLATLIARAEKDALIGELEQAKAVSDEARQRAEAANISKSRFLAQMSHELRTPLNAILGFSEVMKTEVFGEHSVPAYKEYSSDIHNSGVHLLGLINEILDLSRIEAGRYELNEESVSLAAITEDCHHLLKLRAANRGITIHEMFEQDLPRIWADERA